MTDSEPKETPIYIFRNSINLSIASYIEELALKRV